MEYPQEHIKPYGNDGKKSEQVEEMFDNIAPAYDKLNHTLSMGIETYFKNLLTKTSFSARTENKKGNSIVLKEEI